MNSKINFSLVVLSGWLFGTFLSRAATFTPTTTSDLAISSLAVVNSAGQITDQGNAITLRSAVIAANQATLANGGANTINLGAATYQLTIPAGGVLESSAAGNALIGDLDVLAPTNGRTTLTIQGTGPNTTIIQQTTGIDRIIDVHPVNLAGSNTLNVTGVTFTGGHNNSQSGGAIVAGRPGDITALVNCIFDNNGSPNNGGAITQSAGGTLHDLNITNCIFRNNIATNGGAGAVNYIGNGTLNIVGCVFSNNFSGAAGGAVNVSGTGNGGIYNFATTLFISNRCNDTVYGGGAISGVQGQSINAHFCRFIGNTAPNIPLNGTAGRAIGFGGGSLTNLNVFVNQNWWGANSGPATFDVAQALPTQWLQLRQSVSPSPISVGGSATFTADLLGLNTGGSISAASLTGLPSFPMSFGNPVKGNLSGAGTQLVNGQATATFTATSAGTGSADVTVDGQTITSTVSIPLSVSSINRIQSSPTNLTSVQWLVTFNAAVSGVAAGNFILVNTGLGGTPAISSVTAVGAAPATQWIVTATTGSGAGTLGLNMVNATGISSTPGNLPFTGQVYAVDLVPPTINCLSDITATANGYCPALVNFSATVGDNVALANATTNPASGSAFPVGTNTVTVTARDTAGNTNFCSFKVKVVAGAAPQLKISQAGGVVFISWTNSVGCYGLQTASALKPAVWSAFGGSLFTLGGNIFATNAATTNRFYRLSYLP